VKRRKRSCGRCKDNAGKGGDATMDIFQREGKGVEEIFVNILMKTTT